MANIPLKRLRIPIRLLPGNSKPSMLDKFNVPGIDITGFRTYQYRTKAWRVEGYNHALATGNETARSSREYRLNINGFKAWEISLKNGHPTPVDIIMNFTIDGKYGVAYDHIQKCNNLLPGQQTEVLVIPWMKTARVRLDTVEVYAGSDLLSSTEVNSFLPFREGSFALSFFIAFFMGLYSLIIPSINSGIPVIKSGTTLLSILAFYIAFWEAFNITPVIFMFLLVLLVSFILHDPLQIGILIVMGCLYLWSVWIKRSSIKDFLIGAFIP